MQQHSNLWNNSIDQLIVAHLAKKFPSSYETRKGYCRVHNMPRDSILSQINPVHTITHYFPTYIPFGLKPRTWPLSFKFPDQNSLWISELPCILLCLKRRILFYVFFGKKKIQVPLTRIRRTEPRTRSL
jgi:hypothetical protein